MIDWVTGEDWVKVVEVVVVEDRSWFSNGSKDAQTDAKSMTMTIGYGRAYIHKT